MKKDIKIVIPCYDRFDLLRQTLQSLKDFKVIFDTFLFYDGIAPDEVKEIAKRFQVGIKETGDKTNCGADMMIYKSTMLFDDHVLIIDSDTIIIKDFTPFILDNIKLFENDKNVCGISISKGDIYLINYKGYENARHLNMGCGTIYDKEHVKDCLDAFVKYPDLELDSHGGKIAQKNKLYYLSSKTVFTKHLGLNSGFHSSIDIVHS